MADFILGRLKFNWRGDWVISTAYVKDDIVKYGANTYTCLVNHTSLGTISGFYTSLSAGNWSLHSEGLNFAGDWTAATFYKLNDLVKFGAYQYRCILQHTSGGTFSIGSNWSVYSEGFQFEDSYSSGTQYQDGDVVTYGGYAYIFVNPTPATGSTPSAASSDWDLLAPGFTATGDYSAGTAYKTGQTINFGGWAYVCVTDTTAGQSPYTHSAKWVKINEGFRSRGSYSSITTYFKGDVVEYLQSSYVAKEHNLLNILPTDSNNWQVIAFGDTTAVMLAQGDIITRNTTIPEKVSIGENGSVLTTNIAGTKPIWGVGSGTVNKYVSVSGSDSNPGTENLPYRTIKYALSQANKQSVLAVTISSGGTGGTPNIYTNVASTTSGSGSGATFRVETDGSSVPTSVKILNNGGNYAVGDTITINGSSNLGGASNLVLTVATISIGDIINVEAGTFKENLPLKVPANVCVRGSSLRNTVVEPNTGSSSSVATITTSSTITGATNGTYKFKQSTTTSGSGLGLTVNITVASNVVSAVAVYHGGYGYAVTNTSTLTAAAIGCGGTGTLTITVATLELNTASNMWLLNNNTNLTLFTFKGLTGLPVHTGGTLGAIVTSLDPASTITSVSPYIQDCTSICENAIGLKIDGNLHTSGNKSIVVNDYTQINSDGTGVWAIGGGRAELVSVFTYYCNKSLYASDGGFIRGLNCSSAYGEQGAVAEGTLASETAIVVQSRGKSLQYQPLTVSGAGIANFAIGDTLLGQSSGATGTIIRTQTAADRITIDPTTGTFTQNETVTVTKANSTTYTFQIKNSAAAVPNGQTGFFIELDSTDVNFLDQSGELQLGDNVVFTGNAQYYAITAVDNVDTVNRRVTVKLNPEVTSVNVVANNTTTTITRKFSNVRLTGHDFLDIGTGGIVDTNYPNTPLQAADQEDEIATSTGGRVYFSSTDQRGDFRVGDLFRIQQSTGVATLNADAFDLSGLTELQLGSIGAELGTSINEFSTDTTMSGNSDLAVPTEKAVKTYVDSGTTTLTNKTISGSTNTLTNIANNSLTNSTLTLRDDASSSISLALGGTLKLKSNVGITTTVSQGDTININLDDPISSFNATTASITNLTSTNADIKLLAGTASNVPLEFSSGTFHTASPAGSFEYNGKIFTSTPVTSKRGLSPSTMLRYNNATSTITNATGLQNWLGAVNVNVAAATAYLFRGQFRMSRAAGGTTHTINLGFGGTATLTAINYQVISTTGTGNILISPQMIFLATAASTAVTASSTSTTENNYIEIQGVVEINGAGTFIPQVAFSAAPGGAGTIAAGAYFEITPIGVNAAAINVGDWV
jgi:hypothetical protein